MERYALFCGMNYYPSGGWGDFEQSFGSVEESEDYILNMSSKPDWWQIIDLTTGKEVAQG